MNPSPAAQATAPSPDAQYAELIESVWVCEDQWKLDDRIDACVRYAGQPRVTKEN